MNVSAYGHSYFIISKAGYPPTVALLILVAALCASFVATSSRRMNAFALLRPVQSANITPNVAGSQLQREKSKIDDCQSSIPVIQLPYFHA
jgi:hypothetical protein